MVLAWGSSRVDPTVPQRHTLFSVSNLKCYRNVLTLVMIYVVLRLLYKIVPLNASSYVTYKIT